MSDISEAIKPFLKDGVVVGWKRDDGCDVLVLVDNRGNAFCLMPSTYEPGVFEHADVVPENFFEVEEEIIIKDLGGYGSIRTHEKYRLSAKLSILDISRLLPGVAKRDGDGSKVRHEWRFTYKGEPCAIFDWNRDRWCAHGPAYVWKELGFIHEGKW